MTVEELIQELEDLQAPNARVYLTLYDEDSGLVHEPLLNVKGECNVVRLEGGGV